MIYKKNKNIFFIKNILKNILINKLKINKILK